MRWIILTIATTLLTACSLPRWPVDGVMTSPFGLRLDGFWPEVHEGVDVAAPSGTPVRAMARGRVTFAGPIRGYGLTVVIDHGGEVETVYAHLARLDVAVGDRIGAREIVGRVGQTGNASGSHLHFEVRRHGRAQDPVPLLGRPPDPGR